MFFNKIYYKKQNIESKLTYSHLKYLNNWAEFFEYFNICCVLLKKLNRPESI